MILSRRVAFGNLLALCSLPLMLVSQESKGKKCVVYYTRTLNTHILANFIVESLAIPLYRLRETKPYPADYKAMVELANKEKELGITPPLQALPDIKQYDVILLGTPLWSLDISSPIRTFLGQSDFRGKIMIPFVTHAGYQFGNALNSLRELAPQARIANAFECKFALKEKTSRNLKTLNQDKITRNTAFALLQQDKLQTWLKILKGV